MNIVLFYLSLHVLFIHMCYIHWKYGTTFKNVYDEIIHYLILKVIKNTKSKFHKSVWIYEKIFLHSSFINYIYSNSCAKTSFTSTQEIYRDGMLVSHASPSQEQHSILKKRGKRDQQSGFVLPHVVQIPSVLTRTCRVRVSN